MLPVGNQLLFWPFNMVSDVSLRVTSGFIKRRLSSRSLACAILHFPNFVPARLIHAMGGPSYLITQGDQVDPRLLTEPKSRVRVLLGRLFGRSGHLKDVRAAISKNGLQKMGPCSVFLV